MEATGARCSDIGGSMDPANASGGWALVFRDELGVVAGSGASHMEHLRTFSTLR